MSDENRGEESKTPKLGDITALGIQGQLAQSSWTPGMLTLCKTNY